MTFRERLKKLGKPLIIGIAGDSGSGKTTYSNGIRRLLGTDLVKTITMDGYHKENREERKISGRLPLDPGANKLDIFAEHLRLLKEGKKIEVPIYDHDTGNFGQPLYFPPSPIIIIEGLHALYPDFLPFLDFTIYVDPTREIKWQWKYKRDVVKRHHLKGELSQEMLKREAAYKRWIDFQKTEADVVIKLGHSTIYDLAKYELLKELPKNCYKVELIIKPSPVRLTNLLMSLDLSDLLNPEKPPFLLACVPSYYWGKKTIVVHLDGVLSQETLQGLEERIASLTGIPVEEVFKQKTNVEEHETMTAVQLAQLLISWRFLELIDHRLPK